MIKTKKAVKEIKTKKQNIQENYQEENDSNNESINTENNENSKNLSNKITRNKGFTDDNQSWLKPKANKLKKKMELQQSDEEDQSDDEEQSNEEDQNDEEDQSEEEDQSNEENQSDEEDQSNEEDQSDEEENEVKVQNLNNLSDEEMDDNFDSDDNENNEDTDEENDSSNSSDDDMLPIERDNKKLKAKQKEDAKLAEEELEMNIQNQEIFKFPENLENEDKVMTLQEVQQRIKDIMLVLSDFKKYREEGRSRQEYMELLKKDLCFYYSYNEFLMGKLMDMFSISELMEYLEASEVRNINF